MTGFASQLVDSMILKHNQMFLLALGALLSFFCGTTSASVSIAWCRSRRLRCALALPLLFQAILLIPFCVIGGSAIKGNAGYSMSLTVFLLAFIMGVQNAVGTIASGGRLRSTHMTGNITDLGIEFGRWLHGKKKTLNANRSVAADVQRMSLYSGMNLSFIAGGLCGAAGFSCIGFLCVIPLAFIF